MDILQELIASKKRERPADDQDSRRYASKKELEELSRKDKKRKKANKHKKDNDRPKDKHQGVASTSSSIDDANLKQKKEEDMIVRLPKKEVIVRLRERGQPITLFGETDLDRFKRLRKLEALGVSSSDQLRDTGLKQGMQHKNIYEDDDEEEEEVEEGMENSHGKPQNRKEMGLEEVGKKTRTKDDENDGADPTKGDMETNIVRFFKSSLKDWESTLKDRPEQVANSTQGRKDSQIHKQCKTHLKPFIKLVKSHKVSPEIISLIHEIIKACERRDYVSAADSYVKLAIGNAAWPMGVTQVGIHARTGRERINQEKVAHIMNDETQRNYVTSIKRIMTFRQSKYPTDPSKMIQ